MVGSRVEQNDILIDAELVEMNYRVTRRFVRRFVRR